MASGASDKVDELLQSFSGLSTIGSSNGDLSYAFIEELEKKNGDDSAMELNMNIMTKSKLFDATLTRKARLQNQPSAQIFSCEVADSNLKPVTNQKSSGTCWLYATLNVLRQPFMKKYSLQKFQFSVEYLFFWHKYELANFWLESIIDTRSLSLDSRLVQYLLSKGCEDGSQFDSALNLIEKYGVIPAVCNDNELFGLANEVKVKQKSQEMNRILNRKLREFAMNLRNEYDQNKNDENIVVKLQKIKKTQMSQIYNVLVICFGKPIRNFDWKYTNKKLGFQCIKDLSPMDFYQEYVKECYDLNDLVSLVHDPRNEYYKLLEVEHYGNVIGGKRKSVQYINVPMDVLKKYTISMLKEGKICWFACDVRMFYHPKFGSLDETQFDYSELLRIDEIKMSKQEYLEYGGSCNSHSMVLCGFDDDENGNVTKWKVENSWSDKRGNKGFVMLTDKWFDKFVYQVLIEKDKLSNEIVSVLDTQPIILPRWDPFAQ